MRIKEKRNERVVGVIKARQQVASGNPQQQRTKKIK